MQTEEQRTILDSIVMERAIIYARVSSDDSKKDGRNLAGQLEMGRDYATEKGYTIVEELAEDDRGASGAEIDLPQLARIRAMAQAGEVDVLVVREIDRLSRNLAKQLIVEQELETAGVRIEYVLGEYSDTAEGRLQKHIKATIAEYEREKIKERMARGRRNKVKAGSVNVAKQPPFGYEVVYDEKGYASLEVVEAEAETVRIIFELYLQGSSISGIATKLTKLGIPTPADLRKFTSIKQNIFAKWSSASVHHILKNETYIGKWHYGKKKKEKHATGIKVTDNPRSTWIEVEVPPIVPPKAFKNAQKRLEANKARHGKPNRGEYLLAKRCACGECGYKMQASRTSKHTYYLCPSRLPDTVRQCSQKSFRQDKADATVWAWLVGILTDEEEDDDGLTSLERALQSQAAEFDRQRMPLQRQHDAAQAQIKQLSDELDSTLSMLKTLKPGSRAYAAVLDDINRVEDALNKLDVHARRLTEKLEKVDPAEFGRIREIARQVGLGVKKATNDFALKRKIVDTLSVEVKLVKEDNQQVAYVTCELGQQKLPILSNAI